MYKMNHYEISTVEIKFVEKVPRFVAGLVYIFGINSETIYNP